MELTTQTEENACCLAIFRSTNSVYDWTAISKFIELRDIRLKAVSPDIGVINYWAVRKSDPFITISDILIHR